MIKFKSERSGEYPRGFYWTPGEVKQLDEKAAKSAPGWLSKVTPPKKKKKPSAGAEE
jgi:hypothetical protein|tara:strand:+ start:159 stop:329 length:171 start_codon:yes stop_codon:yes gene_type:complete